MTPQEEKLLSQLLAKREQEIREFSKQAATGVSWGLFNAQLQQVGVGCLVIIAVLVIALGFLTGFIHF